MWFRTDGGFVCVCVFAVVGGVVLRLLAVCVLISVVGLKCGLFGWLLALLFAAGLYVEGCMWVVFWWAVCLLNSGL